MKASHGDRWAIIAASGGGKTTAVQAILVQMQKAWPTVPIEVLDPKHEKAFNTWWNLPGVTRWKEIEAPQPLKKSGIMIWRPPDDSAEAYNEYLKRVYLSRKRRIVYIDELSSLGGPNESAQGYPRYLRILLKQARSLGITFIIGSQEVGYIPRQILGQSNKVLTGHLNLESDKERMARFYGFGNSARDWQVKDQHGLWFIDPTKVLELNPPIYYKNIQEFLS